MANWLAGSPVVTASGTLANLRGGPPSEDELQAHEEREARRGNQPADVDRRVAEAIQQNIPGGMAATSGGLPAELAAMLGVTGALMPGQYVQRGVVQVARPDPANPLGAFGAGDNGIVITGRDPLEYADAAMRSQSRAEWRVSSESYQRMTEAERKYLPEIVTAALNNNLDPALLWALVKYESGFNPRAVSSAGAQGLTQLMPGTARGLRVTDPFDVRQNLDGGARYLRDMLDRAGGDITGALLRYNYGPAHRVVRQYETTGKTPDGWKYGENIITAASALSPDLMAGQDTTAPTPPVVQNYQFTNAADVEAAADPIAVELLGREATDEEKKLLVEFLQRQERDQQTTQFNSSLFQAEQLLDGQTDLFTPQQTWPDFENGRAPDNALVAIGRNHRLRPDAAQAYLAMVQAAAADGITWGITDSYRDYDTQVALAEEKGLYSQGGLAATPGRSQHGFGLAVDLRLNDDAQAWMQANARRFGFGTIPREPWHWQYEGTDGEQEVFRSETTSSMSSAGAQYLMEEEMKRLRPGEYGATQVARQVNNLRQIMGMS